MEFKRARSDSMTSAGSNGSAQRRIGALDHHSMNAHRRPLEEFLTALRKVYTRDISHLLCNRSITWRSSFCGHQTHTRDSQLLAWHFAIPSIHLLMS